MLRCHCSERRLFILLACRRLLKVGSVVVVCVCVCSLFFVAFVTKLYYSPPYNLKTRIEIRHLELVIFVRIISCITYRFVLLR